MHELALTQSIVEICAERAQGAKVRRVILEIGSLAAVMPDALRFCFDMCAAGSELEGARLEIIDIAGRGRCRVCDTQMEMKDYLARCGCGSFDIECIAGEGLRVKEMEVLEMEVV